MSTLKFDCPYCDCPIFYELDDEISSSFVEPAYKCQKCGGKITVTADFHLNWLPEGGKPKGEQI